MEFRNAKDTMATVSSASSHTERESERKTNRPPVLHSGEEITAKNTLQSNSVARVYEDPLDALHVPTSNKNTTQEVFANACLLDEEDGIVPNPPILIETASSNPIEPNPAAHSCPDGTAAASRLQVSKKWIPCLFVSAFVMFGAGAVAGICGREPRESVARMKDTSHLPKTLNESR